MNGKELKKEFGDYQTPDFFARIVCGVLREKLHLNPHVIIEPTSGLGNFISAALEAFPNVDRVYGLEINTDYCQTCEKRINDDRLQIINDNFFSYEIEKFIGEKETLFVGNPPWATNSELNFNLPDKENFKQLSGTDAITGASNFDICEYIILKLIEKSFGKNVSIAMLCKTSVARNVLLEIDRNNTPVECVKMYNFNSSKIFSVSASACLLFIKMSVSENFNRVCDVYNIDSPDVIESQISFSDGKLSNMDTGVEDLEGTCIVEWRQGVKHDCAGVMELVKKDEGHYRNKNKEDVELEQTLVYPLIKSSSFKKPVIKSDFTKFVIVTQKKTREETGYIKQLAPMTWKYLCDRRELFDLRKSSIYKGAPAFSMFGVGDYSYATYKVGISGFYKKPLFALIYNKEDLTHPVMLDDTSYFLSFNNYSDAYTCMLLLNSNRVQAFLKSISFHDAKRPFTKKVLQRLDLKKCIERIDFEELLETEITLGLTRYITVEMYKQFQEYIFSISVAVGKE